MKDLKYTDILKANKVLETEVSKYSVYEIKVLSNTITSQFNDIFEYVLRSQNINAKVISGEYDNILQESVKCSASNTVIIFWELSNLISGFQYKADIMGNHDIETLVDKTKAEIDFVFHSLKNSPNVIINKFSSLVFNYSYLEQNSFERIGNELNKYVAANLPRNFTVVDIDKILAKISISRSVDLRYYYSSKSLYSIEFYKEYSDYVSPIIFSILAKTKKALILDCDNTLWKGIIGEDGVDGIMLSEKDKYGVFFEEIHGLIRVLSERGVIIGLCSKNNIEDVEEVFLKRDDFALKKEDILIKKINWTDKVTNLREIASELNIGTDSLVFVDDSPFELNFVRENLPEVTALEVGEKLFNYPSMLRENFRLFYKKNITKEDQNRTALYKSEIGRKLERGNFGSLEQYLISLGLTITTFVDDKMLISRTAQLTQKTNQFNFTTKRFTESEIETLIESKEYRVYVFEVSDKFGDYGLTGLAIVSLRKEVAEIVNYLMSCRILGRNVESAFLEFVLHDLRTLGIKTVHATYIPTQKNGQVQSFYENFGFLLENELSNKKSYSLSLDTYKNKNIEYIKIKDRNE